jgi:hypothetical protein
LPRRRRWTPVKLLHLDSLTLPHVGVFDSVPVEHTSSL